jgi:hypothetical protein
MALDVAVSRETEIPSGATQMVAPRQIDVIVHKNDFVILASRKLNRARGHSAWREKREQKRMEAS